MALENKEIALFSMPLDVCSMKLNYYNHIEAKVSYIPHTFKIFVLSKLFQMTQLPLNYDSKKIKYYLSLHFWKSVFCKKNLSTLY